MEFKSKVIILGINEWDVEGKRGITVFYIPETAKNEVTQKGYFPVKKSFPSEMAMKFRNNPFPAVYDIDFSLGSSVGNKLELSISNFTFNKEVEIW